MAVVRDVSGALRRMIEESVIKTVIERTDIVRLISEYVQLRKRGGSGAVSFVFT